MTYLLDEAVDQALDAKLRALLSLCFGNGFKHKRYAFEMPSHRWLVQEKDELVAHLAVHEKTFQSDGKSTPFMGVAEVCVAPSHRGHGLVKAMLREAETHLSKAPFAILLGDQEVYESSGYRSVDNVYFSFENAAKPLDSSPWPQGKAVIEGPPF